MNTLRFAVLLTPPPESEVVLTHNKSGMFESRFVSVGIQASPSVWLKGMEGSALGVWVAHGEGRVHSCLMCSDSVLIRHSCV